MRLIEKIWPFSVIARQRNEIRSLKRRNQTVTLWASELFMLADDRSLLGSLHMLASEEPWRVLPSWMPASVQATVLDNRAARRDALGGKFTVRKPVYRPAQPVRGRSTPLASVVLAICSADIDRTEDAVALVRGGYIAVDGIPVRDPTFPIFEDTPISILGNPMRAA